MLEPIDTKYKIAIHFNNAKSFIFGVFLDTKICENGVGNESVTKGFTINRTDRNGFFKRNFREMVEKRK